MVKSGETLALLKTDFSFYIIDCIEQPKYVGASVKQGNCIFLLFVAFNADTNHPFTQTHTTVPKWLRVKSKGITQAQSNEHKHYYSVL